MKIDTISYYLKHHIDSIIVLKANKKYVIDYNTWQHIKKRQKMNSLKPFNSKKFTLVKSQ